jgi:hypothetical protein
MFASGAEVNAQAAVKPQQQNRQTQFWRLNI